MDMEIHERDYSFYFTIDTICFILKKTISENYIIEHCKGKAKEKCYTIDLIYEKATKQA